MIWLVKRKQLEEKKYNICIENSLQSRIYAYSWYLDIVTDNWDVLVLNDYEAVMPLPWKKKYGLSYVTQPFFCQQLGVFSLEDLSNETINRFIESIPRKFVKVVLQLNSDNIISHSKITKRNNYVLPLQNSFDNLFKNFYKGRKNALKKSKRNLLYVDKVDFNSLLKIAKKEYNHLIYSDNDYNKLNLLAVTLKKNKKGILLGVYDKNNSLLGGVLFLKDNFRITYLFSVMNKKGKNLNAATFLISSVLKEYSEQKYLFDFEGSINVNIAGFFRSFGATSEIYNRLKVNAIQRIFI